MRRMQTIEKVIGENTFYIRPFGAFAAANISGELAALLSPILAGIAPLFGGLDTGDGGSDAAANPLDMDIEEAMPAISSALSTISGDKVERMMRRLLIDQQNISVQGEDTDGNTVILDKDLADEVFCGELQDMRETAKKILTDIHRANNTNFVVAYEDRIHKIEEVVDGCSLLLEYITICMDEGIISVKKAGVWTKKVTDVKYMAMAWLKGDRGRANKLRSEAKEKEDRSLYNLVMSACSAAQSARK